MDITRTGYAILSKDELQPERVTEALYVRDFNWTGVLAEADTSINGVLYRPVYKAGKKTDRWHARAHCWGYDFWLYLDSADIAFLERALGISIRQRSHWFDEPLYLQVKYAGSEYGGAKGIRRVWADTLVSADPRDCIIAQLDAAHNGTAGPDDVCTSVALLEDPAYKPAWYAACVLAEPELTSINEVETAGDTFTHVDISDDYPPEFDWFPPVAVGRERPRFISASGQAGA